MDCGTSLVKYILFLFNILCAICGIVLISFGVLIITSVSGVHNIEDAVRTQQIPVALIVLGSIILIISFFGCCGAIRESYCMTMTYSVFLLILLVLQVVFVSYIWVNKTDYLSQMEKVVDKAWNERSNDPNVMDALQTGFNCCGKDAPTDYIATFGLPKSCCNKGECGNPTNIHLRGCRSAFRNFWDSKSDNIKYVGLGIAVVELVGFIFACCLANNIRNFKRRADY